MQSLQMLIGSESAGLATHLAEDRRWPDGELTRHLATSGRDVQQRFGELPKSHRQYLETAASLQETLRRFETLAASQRELEALEAALESEAATLAEGREPAESAVGRAQALLAENRPPEEPATEELRTACHWGLAELRYEDEVAGIEPDTLELALRLAAHALGARRASLHYKLFTFEHDNMVLQMRLGALTSRIAHLRADLHSAG
jgi:hypothetical protein